MWPVDRSLPAAPVMASSSTCLRTKSPSGPRGVVLDLDPDGVGAGEVDGIAIEVAGREGRGDIEVDQRQFAAAVGMVELVLEVEGEGIVGRIADQRIVVARDGEDDPLSGVPASVTPWMTPPTVR